MFAGGWLDSPKPEAANRVFAVPPSRTRALRIAALASVVVASVACSEPDPTASPPTTTESTAPAGTASPSTTAPVTASAIESRLEWVAQALTAGTVTEEDYQATFASDFLNAVSYAEFVAGLDQLGGDDEVWSIGEFESREGVTATALLTSSGGESLRANMTVEDSAPYRIVGLVLQPAEPPTLEDPPQDLQSGAERLAGMGETKLAVMEVEGGECAAPTFEFGDVSEPMPIGSAFKLYVLGAVADAVAAGDLAWDDDIPIEEEHRSIPTGVLQDEQAGETFSLREMAEVMIAFSDNTATDHLIALVGREAVEQAFTDYGMENPQLNIPLMDTMDLAALKVGPASGLATQWLDADEEGRRQILAQISDIHSSDIPVGEFVEPVLPDQIEWFATPADMCRVLAQLHGQGEPLTQILSINPGLPDEEERFEAIAFKGGAEPGVTSSNWLVERPDGRQFVVSGSVLNPDENMDQLQVNLLFGAIRDLVADL